MDDRKAFPTIAQARDIVTIALVILVGWRIVTAGVTVDFGTLSLTDVLALLLGFFAIALSALFYFKATETSNRFYDNTYKFTKEMSEILGRIEAGFGERLRHLDEGWSGIQQRLDRMPFDFERAEKEVEAEEKEVEKLREEREQLIATLAERAKLHEGEKEEFFEQLESREQALSAAQAEVSALRRRIAKAELEAVPDDMSARQVSRARFFLRRFVAPLMDKEWQGSDSRVPLSIVSRRFRSVKQGLPEGLLEDLRKAGIVDAEHDLTRFGAVSLRDELAGMSPREAHSGDQPHG